MDRFSVEAEQATLLAALRAEIAHLETKVAWQAGQIRTLTEIAARLRAELAELRAQSVPNVGESAHE